MCEGSDSSEYLPEAEEGVQGGDDTDFEDEPVPLEIQPPVQTRVRKVCAKRAESSANMAPGEKQAKRVRPIAPIEVSPGVSTESKRQQTSAQAKDNTQKKLPENNGANRPGSPLMDQSYPDDAQGDDEREQGEEQTNQQTKSTNEVPWRRVLRNPMAATNGFKLPIFVVEGNERPHEPLQAAKFASEAGLIIRSQVPIFAHWKQYKKQTEHFDNFMVKLAGRLGINTNDKPTKKACLSVFKSGVRQTRHRLKQAYFDGVPANEIRMTSPVPYMTDAQWRELVESWSSDKKKAICEKNKRNRSEVKYPQATGSRSYVAQLHSFAQDKMPGGSRRPRRSTRSVYASRGIEDEALEDTTLEELRTRPRRSATTQLFASEEVQDEDDGREEDGDDEDGGHEDGGEAPTGETAASGSSRVYQRGITRLPSAPPAPEYRPLLRPEGDNWRNLSGGSARLPTGILGLLIKKHYPGLITRDDGTKTVPWHWPDFFKVKDEYDVPIGTKIKREFWEWFTCEPGYEAQASVVQDKVAKSRLKDMYYEAHVQVLITYYANVKHERLAKKDARTMILEEATDIDRESYLQFPADWCKSYMDCWEVIVDEWRKPEAYEERRRKSSYAKARIGPAHHQGSRSLPVYMDAWTQAHDGHVINEFTGYALSHKGKAADLANVYSPVDGPEAYTNPNAYERMAEYTAAARTRHGEEFDPATQPLDTDIMMRVGGGKQHGRYYIAHSAIDPTTVPTLREVRRSDSSTSSDVPIRPRQPSHRQELEALRREMEAREQAIRQEMEAREQAREQAIRREMEAREEAIRQQMERQFRQFASFVAQIPGIVMPPLPDSIFALQPPPSTARTTSAGSNPWPVPNTWEYHSAPQQGFETGQSSWSSWTSQHPEDRNDGS